MEQVQNVKLNLESTSDLCTGSDCSYVEADDPAVESSPLDDSEMREDNSCKDSIGNDVAANLLPNTFDLLQPNVAINRNALNTMAFAAMLASQNGTAEHLLGSANSLLLNSNLSAAFHYQMQNYSNLFQQPPLCPSSLPSSTCSTNMTTPATIAPGINSLDITRSTNLFGNDLFQTNATGGLLPQHLPPAPLNLSLPPKRKLIPTINGTNVSTPLNNFNSLNACAGQSNSRKRKLGSDLKSTDCVETNLINGVNADQISLDDGGENTINSMEEDGNIVVSSNSIPKKDILCDNGSSNVSICGSSAGSLSDPSGQDSAQLACIVCGDVSSGKHYGIQACNGCSGFFKRSVRRKIIYRCQAGTGSCVINKQTRNQCQACRLKKCLRMGMNKDAVQNERQPRNTATIRPETLIRSEEGERLFRDGVASTVSPVYYPHLNSGFQANSSKDLKEKSSKCLDKNSLNEKQLLKKLDQLTNRDLPDLTAVSTVCSSGNTNSSYTGIESVSPGPAGKSSAASSASPQVTRSMSPIFHPIMEDSIYENASRLLFMAVKWAKSLPAFLALPFADQVALLEESWSELFLISTIQWCLPFEHTALFSPNEESREDENNNRSTSSNNSQNSSSNSSNGTIGSGGSAVGLSAGTKLRSLTGKEFDELHIECIQDVKNLKLIVDKFRQMGVDATEFNCLKALSLFRPEAKGLKENVRVEGMQDQAQIMMMHHEKISNSNNPTRFGKLLLLLASLRLISPEKIAYIYFPKMISKNGIEKFLLDIFNC